MGHASSPCKILGQLGKCIHIHKSNYRALALKGVSHEIFWVLFWHVWIDLGLYKNL
jgi:hypothetical protein